MIIDLSNDDLIELFNLIESLNWEYDRMSSSGQKTMERINEILKIE